MLLVPRSWIHVLRWTAAAFALNLVWEIGQVRLYTIYREGDLATIAYAIAHCTVGDAMIAFACYLVAAGLTRDGAWPTRQPGAGVAVAVASGVVYTVFSEWLNVSVRGSWAYAESMPRISGIGVAPLLQWLLVPLGTLYWVRFGKRAP